MILKKFSPKNFAKKLAFLTRNKAKLHTQKFDHNIGFLEKRQFFRRNLSKIAENCDHNIDPLLGNYCIFIVFHGRSINFSKKRLGPQLERFFYKPIWSPCLHGTHSPPKAKCVRRIFKVCIKTF
jgi:hypothetical protein